MPRKKKSEELYTGVAVIENFTAMNEFHKKGKYPLDKIEEELYPNQCVVLKCGSQQSALACVEGGYLMKIREDHLKLFNINPKNKEQKFAFHLLKKADLDLIIVTGCAGSGKTLGALAHAMDQLKKGKKNKLVLAKSLAPVGKEIGFLKGSMMDKVAPWMGAFYDNFEVLEIPDYELQISTAENKIDETYNIDAKFDNKPKYKIEISPITFIQGRSISNAIIIIDEVQNLPSNVVKQILTRPAENCQIILLGDLEQIFEKGLDKDDNGLYTAIMAARESEFIGSIHMIKSERSRLAQWAANEL